MIKMKLCLAIATILSAQGAIGSTTAMSSNSIDEFLLKYRNTRFVQAKIKKSVISSLMGTQEDSTGTLDYSQGKMKLKIMEPKSEALIYDGKIIWTIQAQPKELGGKIQITKSKLDKKSRNKLILSRLFEKNHLAKDFTVSPLLKTDKVYSFSLIPVHDDPNLKKIEISFDAQSKEILSFKYWDEVENQIVYNFQSTQFYDKLPDVHFFQFKIPKNAEVTEL